MTEHLLEKQELTGVVTRHDHLVVSEGLAQRVGSHPITEPTVTSDTLEDIIDSLLGHRLVLIGTTVGLGAEHIVGEANAFLVFKVQGDGFDDGVVDSDVAVLMNLARIAGLLLVHGEPVTERAVVIDKVGKAQGTEVTHAKSKVDAYDEEHIVSPPLMLDEVLGDADDVVHTLDGFGGVLVSQLGDNLLVGGSDETGTQLAAAGADGANVDEAIGLGDVREVYIDNSHEAHSFTSLDDRRAGLLGGTGAGSNDLYNYLHL